MTTGPPEKEVRASTAHREPALRTPALTKEQQSYCSADRRRRAAARCEPLASGYRDPLQHLPYRADAMTDQEFEGWKSAVVHLWAYGLPAQFPAWEMRRLSAYLRCWWAVQ